MKLYLDTSALVKLVIEEEGSAALRALIPGPVCLTSVLAYPEACAALSVASRTGRLDDEAAGRARDRLEDVWAEVAAVSLDEPLAVSAGDLAAAHGLTGADAVHLATAIAVAGDDLAFATWDERLGRAAAASGLVLVP